MGLFKPVWMKPNKEDKALAYIKKTDDEEILYKIAREALNIGIRGVAASKLKNDGYLTDLAVNSEASLVRIEALKRVQNTDVLKHAAEHDLVTDVREAAIKRIYDDDYLAAYTEKANLGVLVRAAVGNMQDREKIAQLAARSKYKELTRECLDWLKNPTENIRNILFKSKNESVLAFAAAAIPEEKERLEYAKKSDSVTVRKAVYATLNDREALYDVAVNDRDRDCRMVAFRRLKDKKHRFPDQWYISRIDERVDDLRIYVLLNASETEKAHPDLVDMLIGEFEKAEWKAFNREYMVTHCTMGLIDAFEERVSAGNLNAALVLRKLYDRKDLNPKLRAHAKAQQVRYSKTHSDGIVGSTVCGQSFRHSDYMEDNTILLL